MAKVNSLYTLNVIISFLIVVIIKKSHLWAVMEVKFLVQSRSWPHWRAGFSKSDAVFAHISAAEHGLSGGQEWFHMEANLSHRTLVTGNLKCIEFLLLNCSVLKLGLCIFVTQWNASHLKHWFIFCFEIMYLLFFFCLWIQLFKMSITYFNFQSSQIWSGKILC